MIEREISALKYYMGKPDGLFFTRKIFGEDVVEAKKAYVTLNTLMGNESAEYERFIEGKKQVSGMLTVDGVKKMLELFVCITRFAVRTKNDNITYGTVRACRQSEIFAGESIVTVLQSTTKLSIEEIMELGYGNKNALAICCYHFCEGAMPIDMELMGKEYLKPEEREVLLTIGAELKAVCRGYDYKFLGKDGKPALVYDVDVMAPSMKLSVYSKADEAFLCDEKVISEVRVFFEQLNNNIVSGEFPEYPEQYLTWKAAFKRVAMNKVCEVYCCI